MASYVLASLNWVGAMVASNGYITAKRRKKRMKDTFYDVKLRKKVEAEVTEKVKYDNGRHALKAKTKDGRNLTKFVNAEAYTKANVGCCGSKPSAGCCGAKAASKKK
ncbi:MAG: hypothetical protein EOM56_13685 [Deltaproteobacteria bacterium]|jgi:hypothetical protein|nr:hypothetical protein [Deltaproteobacteria bacterium]